MKVYKPFIIACIFFVLFFCNLSGAVPANPVTFELVQPNGVVFDARMIGDENNNRVETLEGYTIVKNADNWWIYIQYFTNFPPLTFSSNTPHYSPYH